MARTLGTIDDFARAAFYAVLPAAAAGGAMALPVLFSLAALATLRRPLPLHGPADWPVWLLSFSAFLGWAVLSTAWSAAPGAVGAKIVVLAVLGLFFARATADAAAARLTLAASLAAFAVLALLLTVEAAGDLPMTRAGQPDAPLPTRNPSRGAVVLLALCWGACGALLNWGRPLAAGAALAISGALSAQFGQTANLVAFCVGLAAFAAAFAWPRLTVLCASWGAAAWVLIAPFATPLVTSRLPAEALQFSFASRVAIWEYTSARILEAPWFGRGLDASRAVTDRVSVAGETIRGIPLHPHSASLQIWYETGLVGALLAAVALAWGGYALARSARREGRAATAAAAATIAAMGVIANVSYGLWQEWWLTTLFLAASVVAALRAARG